MFILGGVLELDGDERQRRKDELESRRSRAGRRLDLE
jgi:hypothetical protein